jgi:hypothetical protein
MKLLGITSNEITCICQILEKKWEYNETVHQLFIDFKKAYDSVRREVLHNILIEFVQCRLTEPSWRSVAMHAPSQNSSHTASPPLFTAACLETPH